MEDNMTRNEKDDEINNNDNASKQEIHADHVSDLNNERTEEDTYSEDESDAEYDEDGNLIINYDNIDDDKICKNSKLIGIFYDENGILYEHLWTDYNIDDGVLSAGYVRSSKFKPYIDKDGVCTIPEGVTKINGNAFFANKEIRSIEIPDTVTEIGRGAFMFCPNLEYIKFPDNLEVLEENVAQSGVVLKKIILPSNIKEIKRAALRCNLQLHSIELPEGLEIIGDGVFYNCRNLKTITIPSTLKFIGEQAFMHCWSLETMYVANIEVCNIIYKFLTPYFGINGRIKIMYKDGDSYKEWTPPLDMRCVKKEEIRGGKCPFCSESLKNGEPVYCMHGSDAPIEAQHQAHERCVIAQLEEFCTCPICEEVLEDPIRVNKYLIENKDWIDKEYGRKNFIYKAKWIKM